VTSPEAEAATSSAADLAHPLQAREIPLPLRVRVRPPPPPRLSRIAETQIRPSPALACVRARPSKP